ncbi:MAG: thiamine phosphate synthase [Methanosphaera stadtmanae]|nr:thiamine phosphate synthase [Methanosphaera stadtmanae]
MDNVDYSVYLVTDQFDFTEEEFLNIIEESIIGGATIIQIREKDSETRDFLNLARKVKNITDKYDVPLIINDRLDIALAIDAAGVHVGQDDMPCDIVRKLIGPDKLIGVSAHDYAEAIKAKEDGADYLGIGAFQPTATKKNANVIDLNELEKMKQIDIKSVAIGGVNKDNAKEIISKYNFDGIAVVSAIMKDDNPRKATEELLQEVQL